VTPENVKEEIRLSNLEELRQSAASAPNDVNAQYRYAWALLGLGKTDEARTIFEAAHTHWPGEIEIIYGLAMTLKQVGQEEKARELFLQVMQKDAVTIRDAMLKRMADVQIQVILGSRT
jgi:thioredoxin-like negative regulator of GroEL